MDTLKQDLRFALRVLWKARGFTFIAVVTIALAIGATTSMFSVIEATLFQSLPFPQPEQLVMLYLTRSENGGPPARLRWAYPRFLMLKQNANSFEEFATFGTTSFNVTGIDQPLRVRGEITSASYFTVLGVKAASGRLFLPEEDLTPGEKPLAVIGYGLWKRLFGGSANTIGRQIGINQVQFTIIGVLPEGFTGLTGGAELWVPNMMAPVIAYPQQLTSMQNIHNVLARLRPGVSVTQAASEMEIVGRRVAAAYPADSNDPGKWSATAVSVDDARVDPDHRRSELILMAAVAFVLLIACVNMAAMLLSRAISREREMSIRRALGSSRLRLVRQLLTESIVLAILGGGAGLLLAMWATGAISSLIPPRVGGGFAVQLQEFSTIRVDGSVLAFAAVISLGAGLLFGLAPALYCAGERGPVRRTRKFSIFVVTEVGLALTLLIGAGLMIESFSRLQKVDAGFDPSNVLTFYVQPPQQQYDGIKGPQLLQKILDRVSVIPGVDAATVSICTPVMIGCARSGVMLGDGSTGSITVGRHYVGPDHFKTLRIPLIRGRVFTSADQLGAPNVAIISEAAVRRYFSDQDPIGKRFRFLSNPPFGTAADDSVEIVGVVGDVKYSSLEDDPGAEFYTPYMQFSWWFSYVMVRTKVNPSSLVTDMRRAVAEVDPNLPIDNVMTMEERLGVMHQRPRFSMLLLSIFAGLALTLAALGIYSVTAHSVGIRTKEIGIRMALGEPPQSVCRLILFEGLRLIAVGVALGSTGALALTRVLQSQLYGVSPTSLPTFLVTSAILITTGAAACYFPARRATRVDPLKTLKSD